MSTVVQSVNNTRLIDTPQTHLYNQSNWHAAIFYDHNGLYHWFTDLRRIWLNHGHGRSWIYKRNNFRTMPQNDWRIRNSQNHSKFALQMIQITRQSYFGSWTAIRFESIQGIRKTLRNQTVIYQISLSAHLCHASTLLRFLLRFSLLFHLFYSYLNLILSFTLWIILIFLSYLCPYSNICTRWLFLLSSSLWHFTPMFPIIVFRTFSELLFNKL